MRVTLTIPSALLAIAASFVAASSPYDATLDDLALRDIILDGLADGDSVTARDLFDDDLASSKGYGRHKGSWRHNEGQEPIDHLMVPSSRIRHLEHAATRLDTHDFVSSVLKKIDAQMKEEREHGVAHKHSDGRGCTGGRRRPWYMEQPKDDGWVKDAGDRHPSTTTRPRRGQGEATLSRPCIKPGCQKAIQKGSTKEKGTSKAAAETRPLILQVMLSLNRAVLAKGLKVVVSVVLQPFRRHPLHYNP